MPNVKTVVFDIGNVLIKWKPKRPYDRIYGVEHRRRFFEAVDVYAMNGRLDAGETLADATRAYAAMHPEWREEIAIWETHWNETIGPVIDHSVRLLRGLLGAGVHVVSLSNFGEETFDTTRGMFPFLNEFDQQFISGRMKAIKPDAGIYEMLEAGVEAAPSALLFVDDRQENIDAAAARGWQTHLFDGPARWAARLVDEGLLSEEAAR